MNQFNFFFKKECVPLMLTYMNLYTLPEPNILFRKGIAQKYVVLVGYSKQ